MPVIHERTAASTALNRKWNPHGRLRIGIQEKIQSDPPTQPAHPPAPVALPWRPESPTCNFWAVSQTKPARNTTTRRRFPRSADPAANNPRRKPHRSPESMAKSAPNSCETAQNPRGYDRERNPRSPTRRARNTTSTVAKFAPVKSPSAEPKRPSAPSRNWPRPTRTRKPPQITELSRKDLCEPHPASKPSRDPIETHGPLHGHNESTCRRAEHAAAASGLDSISANTPSWTAWVMPPHPNAMARAFPAQNQPANQSTAQNGKAALCRSKPTDRYRFASKHHFLCESSCYRQRT